MFSPRIYKTFSCSTQLSTKFIMLINVKMPTIVGILTCISLIDTRSERLKAENFFSCGYLSFYEQLKFRAQLSRVEYENFFITLGPELLMNDVNNFRRYCLMSCVSAFLHKYNLPRESCSVLIVDIFQLLLTLRFVRQRRLTLDLI